MKSKNPNLITSKRKVLIFSERNRDLSTPRVNNTQAKCFRFNLNISKEMSKKLHENTIFSSNCKTDSTPKNLISLTETDRIPPLKESNKSLKKIIFQKTNSITIKKNLDSPYLSFFNNSLEIIKSVSDNPQIKYGSKLYNTLSSFRLPSRTPKNNNNPLKTFFHSTQKSNDYFIGNYNKRVNSFKRTSGFPDLNTYKINTNLIRKQNTIEFSSDNSKKTVKSYPSFVVRLCNRYKVVDSLKIKKIQYSKKDYDKNMIRNKFISEKLLIRKPNICHKLKLDKFKV